MDDFQQAREGFGRWVSARKVPADTNVFGRIYRTASGHLRKCYYIPLPEPAEAWFFPSKRAVGG